MVNKMLIALGVAVLVAADLPIHCIHKDVVGTWLFEVTENNHDNSEYCGYSAPDNNADHFGSYNYKFNKKDEFTVVLGPKNTLMDAQGQPINGNWTMVYDEGFELTKNGHKYFSFFHYDIMPGRSIKSDEVSDYISYCDKTRTGWYHTPGKNGFGCYRALQTHDRDGRPVIRNGDHLALAQRRSSKLKLHQDKIVSKWPTSSESDTSKWKPSYSFIEAVNKDTSMHWSAKAHNQFEGKTHGHMRNLLGHRKFQRKLKHGDGHGVDRHTGRLRGMPAAHPHDNDDLESMKTLPKEFDWRNVNASNYVTPVVNQGSCGSCYAISSVGAFESRLRIAKGADHEIFLSAQDILSCSQYNQGCEGGYPFLVAKYGNEYGFVEETSLPYEGTDAMCDTKKRLDMKKYTTSNYRYVGGFYGACNEARMMKEVYEKGPVVVAFEAPGELFYYDGGIFTGAKPKVEVEPKEDRVNNWEQTNHAVLAVGWGYDKKKDMKYWIIKNEWGDQWGEGGYFRIRKGTDECGIESMAVTADISPVLA